MQVRKNHLEVVPAESRDSRRKQSYRPTEGVIHLNGSHFGECVIVSREIGRFVVQITTESRPIPLASGDLLQVEVLRDGQVIINGNWLLSAIRTESSTLIIVFEIAQHAALIPFHDYLHPEIFFKTAGFRILSFSRSDDLSEIEHHFTDLKDFPLSIPCTLRCGAKTFEGHFDFSSNARELTSLEFRATRNQNELPKRGPVIVDYVLFSVRYLFVSESESVDSDFGTISLSIPEYILAITARRFYRLNTKIKVRIRSEQPSSEFSGEIVQISGNGGDIALDSENVEGLGDELHISAPEYSCELRAVIASKSNSRIAVEFCMNDSATRQTVMKLLIEELQYPLAAKEPGNYDKFLQLYEAVGYAPADSDQQERWKEESRGTWRKADEVLPGNCVGAFDKGTLICSMGTFPISEHIAYGHSLCAIKSVKAASFMLDQMAISLAWSNVIPGIQFAGGSFAKKSKFTTRVYVSFQAHAFPSKQWIVHVQRLFPRQLATNHLNRSGSNYRVESVDNPVDLVRDTDTGDLIQLLAKPFRMAEGIYTTKCYKVIRVGQANISALLLDFISEPYLTAADVFQYLWVFVTDEKTNIAELVTTLRSIAEFGSKTVQVVLGCGNQAPNEISCGELEVPAFWAFTRNDELGPVIASIHRAVYAVLRKYGEAALPEMVKLM